MPKVRNQLRRLLVGMLLVAPFHDAWADEGASLSTSRVDVLGNVYCRASASAGERPWGGVRITLKGHPEINGESDPEHGRFRLTVPTELLIGKQATLVYAQSNLLLGEVSVLVDSSDTMILAGRPTAQISPKIFMVPYCAELETPRLREMVKGMVDRISHRAAVVHSELVRAHSFGSPETASCLDDVLSRMGAHLRHAESCVPAFIDALGEDMLRARREVTKIKIADERAAELSNEADFCLEHHAPHPGADTERYLPDLEVSPAGVTVLDVAPRMHPFPWDHPAPSSTLAKNQSLSVLFGTAFETGFDSNFLQLYGNQAVPGFHFRPSTHLSLRVQDLELLAKLPPTETTEPVFEANLSATSVLLSATNDHSPGLSKQSDLGVVADVVGRMKGTGPFSAIFFGNYQRRVEPSIEPEQQFTFGQNDFRVGADADLVLGKGQFDIGASYSLRGLLHDSVAQANTDRLGHRLTVHERLRFLPETALVHETELKIRSYLESTAFLHNGEEIRSRLGIMGMLGNRFAFSAFGGVAQSNLVERIQTLYPVNFDGLLASAKLSWFFGPVANSAYEANALARPELTVSYDHDYREHVVTDNYLEDRGVLQWTQPSGLSFLFRLYGGVSRIAYKQGVISNEAGAVGRSPVITGGNTEIRVQVGAQAEYVLYRNLRLTGRLAISDNLSNLSVTYPDPATVPAKLAFSRVFSFLGANYRF